MSSGEIRSLALLLDASPAGWAALHGVPTPGVQPLSALAYVQQVLAFVDAYLLQSESNELAVWGVGAGTSRLLWTSPSLDAVLGRDAGSGGSSSSGGSSGGGGAAAAVLAGMQELAALDSREEGVAGEAAWSAAVARALCLLRKAGRGATDALQHAHERAPPPPRLLCLKAAPDAPPQYLASMNAAFSAQRCGVVLDACVLGAGHSAFLQQAAHLTGGVYLRPDRPAALLQYLLAVFLPAPGDRAFLSLPAGAPVDLRASCFCHRRPVDIGYACSVCLSVFCQRAAECSTCGTAFAARKGSAVKRPLAATQEWGQIWAISREL